MQARGQWLAAATECMRVENAREREWPRSGKTLMVVLRTFRSTELPTSGSSHLHCDVVPMAVQANSYERRRGTIHLGLGLGCANEIKQRRHGKWQVLGRTGPTRHWTYAKERCAQASLCRNGEWEWRWGPAEPWEPWMQSWRFPVCSRLEGGEMSSLTTAPRLSGEIKRRIS